MKIKLVGATFYMNDPIYLSPVNKEAEVNLDTLEDKVVRILAAGVSNGLVVISEGQEDFLKRVELLSTKKDNIKAIVVEEVKEEPKTAETVVETKVPETVEEAKPVAKKATATKATTAKKATTK